MPSKPAKYGIKLWVTCDARSSYAWKMQVYTGKPERGGLPEKNLATRVVLELTEGLGPGRNVTCDNFFTSHELARRLLAERGLTLLGTLRINRPEIPRELLDVRGRAVGSSSFAFSSSGAPDVALVSYLAKRNKNVLLLATADRYLRGPLLSDRADRKPLAVLHYNRTKGGVDNLDKVAATYSCRRKTCRWPLVLFHNMVDVSAYNAFVLWRELNPAWMAGRRNRRRLFTEQLGKALVAPLVIRKRRRERARERARERERIPRRGDDDDDDDDPEAASRGGVPPRSLEEKRKRCRVCPRSKDIKTKTVCRGCRLHVCGRCALKYCPACAPASRGPLASSSSSSSVE